MTPDYRDSATVAYLGRLEDVLPTMDEASVDAVVCDPPYELGFMGRKWDSSGVAYQPDTWRHVLRVLKPGGHLLAFGGTRTWHRMVVAIEDAGFEIRDEIMWLYGSGFPKSLNVATAVDRAAEAAAVDPAALLPDEARFCEWVREGSGLTVDQVRRLFGSARFYTGTVEIVNTATVDAPRMGRRAMVPTFAAWRQARPSMPTPPPAWVEAIVKDPPKPAITHPGEWKSGKGQGTAGGNEWSGWGTALKPAHEPIVVARKPLAGTVAANVLSHGTGALNIDGCRIDYQSESDRDQTRVPQRDRHGYGSLGNGQGRSDETFEPGAGRWPANVVLDETAADVLDRQSGETSYNPAGQFGTTKRDSEVGVYGGGKGPAKAGLPVSGYGDRGGASRFFYCAKAGAAEKGWQTLEDDDEAHPTVKPLALMRWLVRLVTPPGGTVLDPFAGTGTTAEAAAIEGMRAVLVEEHEPYMRLIRQRLSKPMSPVLDFGGAP